MQSYTAERGVVLLADRQDDVLARWHIPDHVEDDELSVAFVACDLDVAGPAGGG